MTIAILALIAWTPVSLLVGILIGRGIHLADEAEQGPGALPVAEAPEEESP